MVVGGRFVQQATEYLQFNRPGDFRLLADSISPGLLIFAIGLFKKVVLADTSAIMWATSDARFPARLC
jgi:hypothetical protein